MLFRTARSILNKMAHQAETCKDLKIDHLEYLLLCDVKCDRDMKLKMIDAFLQSFKLVISFLIE